MQEQDDHEEYVIPPAFPLPKYVYHKKLETEAVLALSAPTSKCFTTCFKDVRKQVVSKQEINCVQDCTSRYLEAIEIVENTLKPNVELVVPTKPPPMPKTAPKKPDPFWFLQ
jgi:hypothetical protein